MPSRSINVKFSIASVLECKLVSCQNLPSHTANLPLNRAQYFALWDGARVNIMLSHGPHVKPKEGFQDNTGLPVFYFLKVRGNTLTLNLMNKFILFYYLRRCLSILWSLGIISGLFGHC